MDAAGWQDEEILAEWMTRDQGDISWIPGSYSVLGSFHGAITGLQLSDELPEDDIGRELRHLLLDRG
jgi:hypothetical protein